MLKYKGSFNKKVQTVVGEVTVDEFGLVKGLKKEDEDILLNGFNFEQAEESKSNNNNKSQSKSENKEDSKEEGKSSTTKKTTGTTRKTTARKTTKKTEEK